MEMIPNNWGKFQHYKDRCPPWIKLHKELLNDRAFMSLPLASKALAPLLWLLASEDKSGVFDADVSELAFRLRITEEEIKQGLKPLIDKEFLLDASTMLAPCLQHAIPETETEERQRERHTLVEKSGDSEKIPSCPVKKIVECYNQVLADRHGLARVRDITGKRETNTRARWRQNKRFQSLDWWKKYFEYVSSVDFLMGRKNEWKADYDFLVTASKFQKVIEQGYE